MGFYRREFANDGNWRVIDSALSVGSIIWLLADQPDNKLNSKLQIRKGQT
jgi:hypothetical protein